MLRAIIACHLAVVSLCAFGQEAVPPDLPEVFPAVFDAVAQVEVQGIQHTLRASDIRRVEHGAPMPIIPYKARLSVNRVYPQLHLPRLVLEGIAATTWMPEAQDQGLLVLVRSGTAYMPAAAFPAQGFLPYSDHDGVSTVVFPPESGSVVDAARMWECLCDLLDARTEGDSAARIEKWSRQLGAGPPGDAVAALFLLMNVSGAAVPWGVVSTRLASQDAADSLAMEPIADLIAAYAFGHNALPAVTVLLDAFSRRERPPARDRVAQACLRVAARTEAGDQAAILEKVLTAEFTHRGARTGLIDDFAEIESLLAGLEGPENDLLLVRMLHEPGLFAPLRTAVGVAAFWNLLAGRNHPELPQYLRTFLKEPDAGIQHLSLAPGDIQELVRCAEMLLADMKTPDLP